MKPINKIKKTIILKVIADEYDDSIESLPMETDEDVEYLYEVFHGLDSYGYEEEFRQGEYKTKLKTSSFSRCYESTEVASKMFDGTLVGWTYWYGGGKHGDPSSIDWMYDSYEVTSEPKVVTIDVFTRVEN